MYAVEATAKNRCPTVMCGVAQKTINSPSISGCRHHAYSQRWVNSGEVEPSRRTCRYACFSPRKSA